MKTYADFTASLSRKETVWGWIWLIFSAAALSPLLRLGNSMLGSPLSASTLNLVYHCINLAAVLCIFRRFLAASFRSALRTPFAVVWYACLGYLGSETLGRFLLILIYRIVPDFANINNGYISAMLHQEFRLLAICIVFLVPVVEETLYRGLLFRGLFGKSTTAAYLISMALFAAAHMMPYVGIYSPLQLFLNFLQYLPAGYCLCWCYRQTGTIATPILMHALVNAIAIGAIRGIG